nr:hypothetical protein [Tanacetum cinerariifolium]
MSYLSDFQELNDGYVPFGGNPKGGKILGKGKIKTDFKLPDESQVLLRVPREKNMYNVNLKDIDETSPTLKNFITGLENQLSLKVKVIRSDNGTEFKNSDLNQFYGIKRIKMEFSVPRTPQQNGTGPTWLFDIDSLTKTMNYQPVTAGNQTNPSVGFQDTFDIDKAGKEANLQYVLFPVWSTGSSNSQNKEGNTAFDEKEHDAEKAESAVNLSLSRFFEDFSKDSSNDVSAASPIVPTTG